MQLIRVREHRSHGAVPSYLLTMAQPHFNHLELGYAGCTFHVITLYAGIDLADLEGTVLSP